MVKKPKYSVIVISDSCFRGAKEDISGKLITKRVGTESLRIVPDEISKIRKAARDLSKESDILITCGGTGLSLRDVTLEALRPMFSKEIVGFGELFRFLSYEKIGVNSMLTKASAGIVGECVVFCLPGSPDGAKLGCDLILQVSEHLLRHLRE
ncbi:MAG: molybdenum cofactor biosynthesis protein B [Candidatus Methanofastidiosia archaeon]